MQYRSRIRKKEKVKERPKKAKTFLSRVRGETVNWKNRKPQQYQRVLFNKDPGAKDHHGDTAAPDGLQWCPGCFEKCYD